MILWKKISLALTLTGTALLVATCLKLGDRYAVQRTCPRDDHVVPVATAWNPAAVRSGVFQDPLTVRADSSSTTDPLTRFRIAGALTGKKGYVILADRENGKTVFLEQGQTFEGFEVRRIDADRVTFSDGKSERTMAF
jgi:type II secretory pathway component PulC